jgi:hypothetical protein
MTSPNKKPALGQAMKQVRKEATVKDVDARAEQLAAACTTLKVSHKGPMDIKNKVHFGGMKVPEALGELDKMAALLESIAAAETRLPQRKQASAARRKKETLKAYRDLDLWIEAAVDYHYVVMKAAADDAQGRVDWKAGKKAAGGARSGVVLGSRT